MTAFAPTASTLIAASFFALTLSACGQTTPKQPVLDEPPPPRAAPSEAVLNPAQEEAYQSCLESSMAVATAWELIEENCRAGARNDAPDLEAPSN